MQPQLPWPQSLVPFAEYQALPGMQRYKINVAQDFRMPQDRTVLWLPRPLPSEGHLHVWLHWANSIRKREEDERIGVPKNVRSHLPKLQFQWLLLCHTQVEGSDRPRGHVAWVRAGQLIHMRGQFLRGLPRHLQWLPFQYLNADGHGERLLSDPRSLLGAWHIFLQINSLGVLIQLRI